MDCSGTAQEVAKIIQEAQKAPNAWVCCGNQCIRASEIAIVTEEKLPPDDDDGDGPIIVGNPDVVIVTGGQKVLPKRRAPQPRSRNGEARGRGGA